MRGSFGGVLLDETVACSLESWDLRVLSAQHVMSCCVSVSIERKRIETSVCLGVPVSDVGLCSPVCLAVLGTKCNALARL